jgi:hypothetical protein
VWLMHKPQDNGLHHKYKVDKTANTSKEAWGR